MKKPTITLALLGIIILLLISGFFSPRAQDQLNTYRLKNDLEVITIQRPGNLITVQGWVRTGLSNELASNNGLSHFVEHMLFKNIHTVAELERRGAYFNGATGDDFTYFYLILPKTQLKFATDALSKMLFSASFAENDFQKEKKVILEEISQNKDDPERMVSVKLNELMYPGHPYGRKILGSSASIKSYSLEDLKKYFQTYYYPNNSTFVIAGNFNSQELRAALKILGKFKSTPVSPPLIRELPFPAVYTSVAIRNLPAPRLVYAYPVPGISGNDSYALDILTYLLGNRVNSLLNKRLKEELDLVYSVNCNYATRKYRSLFEIEMVVKTKDLSKLQKEIAKLLENCSFADQQLALAKKLILKDLAASRENIENTAFNYGYYNTIDSYKYEKNYLDQIQGVTPEKLKAVLNKYFSEPSQILFITGKS